MPLTKVTFSMLQDGWVNVKDFGAIGNGVANDSAAINLAIAALPDNGVLYFPAGTYLISNTTVRPTSNTTWWISPQATIKNVATSAQYVVFVIDGVHDFTMCGGGTLEGYVVNNPAANAIVVDISNSDPTVTTKNICIDNIMFNGSNGECIFIGSGGGPSVGCQNVTVTNCKITAARRNGIAVGAANFVTITNNEISATYNPDHTEICSGIDVEPLAGQFAKNIYIADNYIHSNYGCGISLYGGTGSPGTEVIRSINVVNNYFDDNCKAGVGVSSTLAASLESTVTVKLNIANNILTNLNGRGGIFVDLNREANVTGNTLTGELAAAAHPTNGGFLSGITINACTNVVVANNSVRTTNYDGLYLYQNNKCIVSNNVADNILINGITSAFNTDCEITGNILSTIKQAGIYSLNDNYCNFLNNRIIDNNTSGEVLTSLQGAAIVVTSSPANTPTNIKVMGNTVRTPTTTPTYPLNIKGADVINCVACPNDFRGTFVNSVTDTGTGTILSQTDVINLT